MRIIIREFKPEDIPDMNEIWNKVVDDGIAFPQEHFLTSESGPDFFASQTYSAVAEDTVTHKVTGLYILHPNNIGRCSHICNASFAVNSGYRGMHIGEMLVKDCLLQASMHGFKIMQFNAVVSTNLHARHLYERLGFNLIGTVPGGFRMKDGHFEDICLYYHLL
jgi:L-amino acid N-acyltransferase YncA